MQPPVADIYRIPPLLTNLNRDFWEGGSANELRIQRCQQCGEWLHPPTPVCRKCRSTNVGAEVVSGRGVIATFTINHYQWSPDATSDPYAIAIIQLDEDPQLRIISNIVGCEMSDVAIGLPVKVVFRPFNDVWLPLFELSIDVS